MHKLLQRQIRKHFPNGQPGSEDFSRFARAVDDAYQQADDARLSVQRSLELMSNELLFRNEQLQADLVEIKRLELELRQADKLRAVGQLAAGVAHEINTPLHFVSDSLGFLDDAIGELGRLAEAGRRLCKRVADGEDARADVARLMQDAADVDAEYLLREFPIALERALEGVARVTQIVVALKDFGRPDQRERTFADLNHGLCNTLTVAQSEIRDVADVKLDLGEVPAVPCFVGDLNQVFLNLLVNAAHAIEQRFHGTSVRGVIQVRTWTDGESAFAEIADNGGGIAAADQPRIFEPFFTTKPVGKGTGQGLVISRSIVTDKHGGSLTFDSEQGHGTRFLIRLPLETLPSSALANIGGGARMNRVLFVDDEPMVLEALRNSLRGKRKEWDMVFMGGSLAGLAELERGPVDVIVTDMRMPGMDGAEFLARATKLCPGATRIILSGQMEEGSLVRAAVTAHRYLTKPCDHATLSASIRRALDLRALLNNERIRASIGGVESLPTVPSVYRALNTALAGQQASPEAIARIIEEDVGISSKVLQIVNSAFFGLPRKTTSLLQAVQYLGLGTIRSLVLSQSLFEQLGTQNRALAESGQAHALQCARIARRLLAGQPTVELAFTAGLLHDIGSLVLACRMPGEYSGICERAARDGVPAHVVEAECLGVTHAEVGAYLLGLWDLHHDVIDIVALHHAPGTPTLPLDAASAVRVAEAISLELTADPAAARAHADSLPEGWLDKPGVRRILSDARAQGAS